MRGFLTLAVLSLCLAACSGASSSQFARSRYNACTHFGGTSLVPSGNAGASCGAFPPAQTVF